MICIVFAIIISIVQRLPWIARFQIDGDWFVLGYCIIIGLSTFILGFVHSRLYDARHPYFPRKRGVAPWWHAIKFFLMQLLIVPTSITVIAALTGLFF